MHIGNNSKNDLWPSMRNERRFCLESQPSERPKSRSSTNEKTTSHFAPSKNGMTDVTGSAAQDCAVM